MQSNHPSSYSPLPSSSRSSSSSQLDMLATHPMAEPAAHATYTSERTYARHNTFLPTQNTRTAPPSSYSTDSLGHPARHSLPVPPLEGMSSNTTSTHRKSVDRNRRPCGSCSASKRKVCVLFLAAELKLIHELIVQDHINISPSLRTMPKSGSSSMSATHLMGSETA